MLPEAIATLLKSALDTSAAVLLAAMGGIFAQQAGVLNIGLEGMMLGGAFAAVLAAYFWGSAGLAVGAAAAAGAGLAAVFGAAVLGLRANVVVAGFGINLAALGVAGYILPVWLGVQGAFAPPGLRGLARLNVPGLARLPGMGVVFEGHTALVYAAWGAVALTALVLNRTVFGLRLRAVGTDTEAVLAAGISPGKSQWAGVLLSGVLAGVAGAQLSA